MKKSCLSEGFADDWTDSCVGTVTVKGSTNLMALISLLLSFIIFIITVIIVTNLHGTSGFALITNSDRCVYVYIFEGLSNMAVLLGVLYFGLYNSGWFIQFELVPLCSEGSPDFVC